MPVKFEQIKSPASYGIGCQVKFADEDFPYEVKATGKRYVILVRKMEQADIPDFERGGSYFNSENPVIYTILDPEAGIRGGDNCHGLGYESAKDVRFAQDFLESGKAEISYRNRVSANVEWIKTEDQDK